MNTRRIGFGDTMDNEFEIRFHPRATDLKEEFLEMVQLFNKTETKLLVNETNGTFSIRPGTSFTAWTIVMHKYMSYSKTKEKFENGSGEYSPVSFWHQLLEVVKPSESMALAAN